MPITQSTADIVRSTAWTALIMCSLHAAACGLIFWIDQTTWTGVVAYFSIYTMIVTVSIIALVKLRP